MRFFLAGGAPMLVILVFGAIALVGAVRFALRPNRRHLGRVCALCAALAAEAVAGSAMCLYTVASNVADGPPSVLIAGFGESLTPLVVGFGLIGAIAILTAAGIGRWLSLEAPLAASQEFGGERR